jgi:UMF1 family MFS transporter
MEFYILGILVGSVMGGSQSSARSLLASFTPMDKGGEFFGFFAVFGKFSAIFGPLIFGTAVAITGNLRSGILSLLALFIIGGLILFTVNEKEGMEVAKGC